MRAGLLFAAALLAGCRHGEPDLEACVPAGTAVVAGVDWEAAKTLPGAARLRERAPGLEGASRAIVAWDGKELLVAASGKFAGAPAGATMASPSIALFGPEGKVKAALAQYRVGRAGAPQLLSYAQRDRAIWAVARGDAELPLTGNAANLVRLLRLTEYTSVAVSRSGGIRVEAAGHCRGEEEASRLRETVGGMLLLLGVKSPAVVREGRVVRVSVQLTEGEAEKLLRAL